jgi:hypothetical protein
VNVSALPENLDHVVAGHVIDNIIGLFFDYVRPAQVAASCLFH